MGFHRRRVMAFWTPSKASGSSPLPRSNHTAVELAGKIYVFGGKGSSGTATDSTLFVLNTAGLKSWNTPKTTGVSPTPRLGHSANMIDKKVYLLGGGPETQLFTTTSAQMAFVPTQNLSYDSSAPAPAPAVAAPISVPEPVAAAPAPVVAAPAPLKPAEPKVDELRSSSQNAAHDELMRLKADLDALKQTRDLVAKRNKEQEEIKPAGDNAEVKRLQSETQSLKEQLQAAQAALKEEKDKAESLAKSAVSSSQTQEQILELKKQIDEMKSSLITS